MLALRAAHGMFLPAPGAHWMWSSAAHCCCKTCFADILLQGHSGQWWNTVTRPVTLLLTGGPLAAAQGGWGLPGCCVVDHDYIWGNCWVAGSAVATCWG